MKQKLVILFAFFALVSNAQTNVKNKIAYQGGMLTYQQYAPNIFKLSFQPKEYIGNENYTDAVILKPMVSTTVALKIMGDTVKVGNFKLIATTQVKEYHGFSFLLNQNEMIFGGGERALPLNRRGYRLNLYNNPWYG